MRRLAPLLALPLCGCFATTGELDKAVADISERIAVVADSAEKSAQAAREAYARGELTYTELQARLRDIRSATLEAGEAITRETVDELKETIRAHPEAAVKASTDVLGAVVPGVPGELIGMVGSALAAYFAATRKAKKDAEDLDWDAKHEQLERKLAEAKK